MIDGTQRPEYFRFASDCLGEKFEHGPSTKCVASISGDGRILGVVVYDGITDFNCMLHVASDGSRRFLSREFLRAVFWVPFVQWRLARVTGLVRATNEAAIRMDLGLGFKQEGVIRRAFGGEDGIILGMLYEECRFLGDKHGR